MTTMHWLWQARTERVVGPCGGSVKIGVALLALNIPAGRGCRARKMSTMSGACHRKRWQQ